MAEDKTLLDLDREDFIQEITENWEKWKTPTKRDDLAQYLIDKAFTTDKIGTLKSKSKDYLRDIVIKGQDQAKEEIKNSPAPLSIGNDVMDFLEDVKHDIHKEKFNVFVKKFAIKRINKVAEKIQNDHLLDKLGIAGDVVAFILVSLELGFKFGYKSLKEEAQKFKAKRTAAASHQE